MKPKRPSLTPCICLVALLALPMSQAAPQAQEASGLRATVIYQDGFEQPIDHLTFVYHWLYRSEANCINCPVRHFASEDFPYEEVSRDVTVERTIPGQEIRRIDIVWRQEGAYFNRAERVVFELVDGSKIALDNPLRCPTVEFLRAGPTTSGVYLSHSGGLTIEGHATAKGQRGKFSVYPFNRGETPKDTVRSIIFHPRTE